MIFIWSKQISKFLPTPSARRATKLERAMQTVHRISTHALREEGDAIQKACRAVFKRFLPTPSARRATCGYKIRFGDIGISTHALREERDLFPIDPLQVVIISTHALREEGYLRVQNPVWGYWDFYPPPPRGGRLRLQEHVSPHSLRFLPTPSARRATHTLLYFLRQI